mgnify:FL=1
MAKKTATCGEYVITVKDDGAIEVYRIYDNVKGALREIAASQNFEYDSQWTTQQFGAKIVKEYGDGKMANVGNYVVTKDEKNHIEVFRTYENTKEALREISEKTGFDYDASWTTRQFGSKLVDFVNGK